jgi:hypothetical protein
MSSWKKKDHGYILIMVKLSRIERTKKTMLTPLSPDASAGLATTEDTKMTEATMNFKLKGCMTELVCEYGVDKLSLRNGRSQR